MDPKLLAGIGEALWMLGFFLMFCFGSVYPENQEEDERNHRYVLLGLAMMAASVVTMGILFWKRGFP